MIRNMRAQLIVIALLIMIGLSVAGCLGGSSEPSWITIVRTEVNALLDRLEVAFKTEDVDLALSCYSDPFVVSSGGLNETYSHEQERAVLAWAFANVDYLIYDIINRSTSVADSANAVATCDIHIKGTNPSIGTMEEVDRVEFTLHKAAGEWQITRYKLLKVTMLSKGADLQGIRAPVR